MLDHRTRIKPNDVLYELYVDLRFAAKRLCPWKFDALNAWMDAAADVVRACPDPDQRRGWAYLLVADLPLIGLPVELALGELLGRAGEKEEMR